MSTVSLYEIIIYEYNILFVLNDRNYTMIFIFSILQFIDL